MESSHEKTDRNLFNEVAEKYCKKDIYEPCKIARRYRLRTTVSVLPSQKNVSILEVGCGVGFSASYLQGMYSKYVGIDYAENFINYAKKFNDFDNTSFEVSNIKDYSTTEKFDVILMIGVVHHLDNVEDTFKSMLKLLKPGGWIVANEPQSSNLFIQLLRAVRGKIDSSYSEEQIQFSHDDLKALYQGAGLKNLLMIPQGIFSTPFAEVPLKPKFLFLLLSRVAVQCDSFLERYFGVALKAFSWNLIAAGQLPDE